MTDTLLLRQDADHIATLTLNRPQARNALDAYGHATIAVRLDEGRVRHHHAVVGPPLGIVHRQRREVDGRAAAAAR